jgi:hypothetical protein
MFSHGSSENEGFKKMNLEFLEHDVLEVEKIQDDLEFHILRAYCDKVMPSRLMKNWKECEEDSLWGFVKQGPYYPQINHEKKPWGSG